MSLTMSMSMLLNGVKEVVKEVVKDICDRNELDYMVECRMVESMMEGLLVSKVVSKESVSVEKKKEVVSVEKVVVEKEVVGSKKREIKCPLPFNGDKNEECCNGLVENYYLMSQCKASKKEGSLYCGSCKNKAEKEGNGMPKWGTIEDRMKVGILEYVAPNGMRPKRYMEVLEKLKFTKEDALEAAEKANMILNECHLEGVLNAEKVLSIAEKSSNSDKPEKVTKGRPKKEAKEVKSSSSRGRPKKEAKEVELDDGDYFATLIAEAEAEKAAEAKKEAVADKVADKVAETVAEKVAETVAEKVAEEEEEEEEEIHVKSIEFEGKKYLKSSTGIIYDAETQDELGEWNSKTEKIEFYPEEEEEEEEYEEE